MSSSAASDKVRASHILIKHQGSRRKVSWKNSEGRVISNTTRETTVSQLKSLCEDIVSGKAKFKDVASRYSDCSSAKRGGDLGLFVAYLSGRQSASGQLYGTYNQDDVDALQVLVEEPGIIDIFLTNEWPSGILNRVPPSDAPPGISDLSGSDSTISELVAEMKPRFFNHNLAFHLYLVFILTCLCHIIHCMILDID